MDLLQKAMILRRKGLSFEACADALFEQDYLQVNIENIDSSRSYVYRAFTTAVREFTTIAWHVKHGRISNEIIGLYGPGRNECPCTGALQSHIGPTILV